MQGWRSNVANSKATSRNFLRHGEIEFFLRLQGLWVAIKEWIPDDEPDPEGSDQRPSSQPAARSPQPEEIPGGMNRAHRLYHFANQKRQLFL